MFVLAGWLMCGFWLVLAYAVGRVVRRWAFAGRHAGRF
jgi:hypothetical protein